MPKITPNLWFDTNGLEAAEFYCSVFPNSKITSVMRNGEGGPGPAGSVLTLTFVLDGQAFVALNGGPHFKFTEAVSFVVNCKTQKEVDHYWEKLSAGGDEKTQQCGWLKDKYGLSWQIVPDVLGKMMRDKDPKKSESVTRALLQMKKLDIQTLKQAYDQK